MFEWEEYFEPQVLERGRNYARKGAVKHITKNGDKIEAIVEGSEYYKVKLRFDGHHISESYCSCPYAGGGSYCKHMAAVLCETQTRDEESFVKEDFIIGGGYAVGVIPVSELIRTADRHKLEEILVELACTDVKTESRIRAVLAGVTGTQDISEMRKEIDSIFYVHSRGGDFIDYHAAMDFADDMTAYLENTAGRLSDDGDYYAAFEVSKYAYVKLGNWDIDDDGEISRISRCCYEIWLRAVQNCRDSEKASIKEWFIEHSEDGTVVDYMEDMLQEFLRYELASKEELQEEIRRLDNLIEKSKGSNKCKKVYSSYYGYDIEAIEFRMILMKHLGADDKEIDDFRRKHMNFQSVRKYYIQRAQSECNIEEEIRLLNESRRLDTESPYLIHSYAKRLIELYHIQKDYAREKTERKKDLIAYQEGVISDFIAYREMCSQEEWDRERAELIKSYADIDKRCELMAEERMLPELYGEISEQGEKLHLFNKYGFLLVEKYSEPILREYCSYVSALADNARYRSSYDELIRYLKRMQQYNGGHEMVRNLCREWIGKYPTRKVMVKELQAML